MLEFIPEETTIINSAKVTNVFPKKVFAEEDCTEEEGAEHDSNELAGITETRDWLNGMFDKNKDPEPLFVLDLILKAGNLVPVYSTNPSEIVDKIREVFERGIKEMQRIPQLEPILMKTIFRTHGQKYVKAPVIPHEKPKLPDPK